MEVLRLAKRRGEGFQGQTIGRLAVLLAAVLVASLLVGLVIGLRGGGVALPAATEREEAYLLLLSQLYSEGEDLHVIRERLQAAGFTDAKGAALELAREYAQSSDYTKLRQARDLETLASALSLIGPTLLARPTAVAINPTPSAGTGAISEGKEPVATATPVLPFKNGVVKTDDGGGAKLRSEPNTSSAVLALIPDGTTVEVLSVVTGEIVADDEGRWFRVNYGDFIGYVYFSLISEGAGN